VAGTIVFRGSLSGKAADAETVGDELANRLISMGARRLLDAARQQGPTNGNSPG
jgi:hypothetical protein